MRREGKDRQDKTREMKRQGVDWQGKTRLDSRSYICGYCGGPLISNEGYSAMVSFPGQSPMQEHIYICHHCLRPTYFDIMRNQTPGYPYGNQVDGISSDDIEALYDEARNCTGYGAYTASVLCCRKLLMNIAVSKGATEGLSYIEYVEFLSNRGYVPPDGKHWVDQIRKKGNEANHEIALMEPDDAEQLISFVEMLLKFIYEFPARLPQKEDQKEETQT